MFNNTPDLNNLPQNQFAPFPEGTYKAIVENIMRLRWVNGQKEDLTHSKIPETEDDIIDIKYQIIEGAQQGRPFFDNLRLWHSNKTAANIAKARLKELLQSCNKDLQAQFEDLYNIPLMITIKHSKDVDRNGNPYVNITKIAPIPKNTPTGAPIDFPF